MPSDIAVTLLDFETPVKTVETFKINDEESDDDWFFMPAGVADIPKQSCEEL